MFVGGVEFTGIGKSTVGLLPCPRERLAIVVGGRSGVPPNQQLNLTELVESVTGRLKLLSRNCH